METKISIGHAKEDVRIFKREINYLKKKLLKEVQEG